MTTMETYTARAVRSSNWWAIEVAELDGVFSQARRLDQVETMARDAIATLLETPPDSFAVKVVPVLPDRVVEVLEELADTQVMAALSAKVAALMAQRVAHILHDEELMPLRDVGNVLHVSHQRAHQLVKVK